MEPVRLSVFDKWLGLYKTKGELLFKITTSFQKGWILLRKGKSLKRSFSLAEDLDGFGISKAKLGVWVRGGLEQIS